MGLFSSKKITTVDTSVSRVISDELLPNYRKTGMVRALFADEGDGQMMDHILEAALDNIGAKAERMYDYGKNTYLYGVPKSTLFYSASGKDLVETVISNLVNTDITLEYYQFGPLNHLHHGWQILVDSYGYDPASNELKSLSTLKGAHVYLDDFQVVVAEATLEELENGSLAQWGTPATAGYTPLRPIQNLETVAYRNLRKHTPYAVDTSASADYFRLSYVWQTTVAGKVTTHTELQQIPLGSLDQDLDYFHAKYSYQEAGKELPTIRYWTYQCGAGTYPALDTLFTSEWDDLGTFFPRAYFRYHKQATSDDPASDEYKHSRKLVQYLGMDYDQVRDEINANPDIDDVESALVMMAVPAKSTDPLEQRYLFDFFKSILSKTGELALPATPAIEEIQDIYVGRDTPRLSMVIQDALFKMVVQMAGLYRHYKAGSIGAKGTYTIAYSEKAFSETGVTYNSPEDLIGTPFTREYNMPCHTYRYQITDSVYEEIEVYNLGVKYFIYGKYADANFENNPTMLIPIDRGITDAYTLADRERLYARSLHYLFNTRIVTKVKWYEKSWFRAVIIIVAVIISALSFNPGPLMAATAVGGIVLAEFLAMVVLKGLVFSMAFKLFVKLVGTKIALILSVLAAVYALGSGAMNDFSLKGVPLGEELMQVATGLTSAANKSIQSDMLDLQEDALEFQDFMKEQNSLLESANKELLSNSTSALTPFSVYGESPTDYFERTVHSGNIGVLGLDVIHNYCDLTLTLPTISQTLGMSFTPEANAFANLG